MEAAQHKNGRCQNRAADRQTDRQNGPANARRAEKTRLSLSVSLARSRTTLSRVVCSTAARHTLPKICDSTPHSNPPRPNGVRVPWPFVYLREFWVRALPLFLSLSLTRSVSVGFVVVVVVVATNHLFRTHSSAHFLLFRFTFFSKSLQFPTHREQSLAYTARMGVFSCRTPQTKNPKNASHIHSNPTLQQKARV